MTQDDEMDARRREELAATRKTGASRSPEVDQVTAGLKYMLSAIAEEPIPEEFLRLLDAIEAREADAQLEIGGGTDRLSGNHDSGAVRLPGLSDSDAARGDSR